MMWADIRNGLFCSSYTTEVIKMMEAAVDDSDDGEHPAADEAAGGRVATCWGEADAAPPPGTAPARAAGAPQRLLLRDRVPRRPGTGGSLGERARARWSGGVVPLPFACGGAPAVSSTASCGKRERRCPTPTQGRAGSALQTAEEAPGRVRLPPHLPTRLAAAAASVAAAPGSRAATPRTPVPRPPASAPAPTAPAAPLGPSPALSARGPQRGVAFAEDAGAAEGAVAVAPKKSTKPGGPLRQHKTRAHARLAATLESLSASKRLRSTVAGGRKEARVAEAMPEAPPELMATIRRLICANPWGAATEKEAPWPRLAPDKQSNYVTDALQAGARDLKPVERERMEAMFREVARGAGIVEEKNSDFKWSSVVLAWSDFARHLKGRVPNVYIQRLGVYFALLKTKVRLGTFLERLGLLLTCAPDKRLRLTFSLLDVGGDGIIGPRDVFAILPREVSEPARRGDALDDTIPGTLIPVVFNAPGQLGLDFADTETSALEVVGLVPGLPAEQQGIRPGDILARISDIAVDALSPGDVRSMLTRDTRPLKLHFVRQEQRPAGECGLLPVAIFETLMHSLTDESRISTRLKVAIVSARGLRNTDISGLSDPYCLCEVEGKPHVRFQTKAVSDCLDPEWNEERELTNYKAGDALKFMVKDRDIGSKPDDVLGQVTIPCSRFLEEDFDQEVPLSLGGRGGRGFLRLRISVLGNGGIAFDDFASLCGGQELTFLPIVAETLTGVPSVAPTAAVAAPHRPLGKAKVALISASGLRNSDGGGKSDPYCVCEIVGKPQLRFQTAVIPDTLDPVWNKRGELDYAKGDSIKLTVLDRDPGSVQNHDVLGHVTLTSWRLQPHGFEGEVDLVDPAGRTFTPKLKLKVALPSMAGTTSSVAATAMDAAEARALADVQDAAQQAHQQDVKELRQQPHLRAACSEQNVAAFEALCGQDFRLRRPAFTDDPMRVVAVPSALLAGRLFDVMDFEKRGEIGVREWVSMIDRWFGRVWRQAGQRSTLGFTMYDLDADGAIGVQDAISLAREVDRLSAVMGPSITPRASAICEEMRRLYGKIADETDTCDDRGVQFDTFRFNQLMPRCVIIDAIRGCIEDLRGDTLDDHSSFSSECRPGPADRGASRGASRSGLDLASVGESPAHGWPASPQGSSAVSGGDGTEAVLFEASAGDWPEAED